MPSIMGHGRMAKNLSGAEKPMVCDDYDHNIAMSEPVFARELQDDRHQASLLHRNVWS